MGKKRGLPNTNDEFQAWIVDRIISLEAEIIGLKRNVKWIEVLLGIIVALLIAGFFK